MRIVGLNTNGILCQTHPEIAELDLNPVIAHADGYSIVDARLIIR